MAFRLTQSAKKGPGATWKAYTKRVKMIKKKQFCRWSQEKKKGPLISTNTTFEKTHRPYDQTGVQGFGGHPGGNRILV
jgi:hypothetical protein